MASVKRRKTGVSPVTAVIDFNSYWPRKLHEVSQPMLACSCTNQHKRMDNFFRHLIRKRPRKAISDNLLVPCIYGDSFFCHIFIANILFQLSNFLAILNAHCVDPEIIKQVFRQVCSITRTSSLVLLIMCSSYLCVREKAHFIACSVVTIKPAMLTSHW